MHKIIMVTFLLLGLSSCASTRYGNFAEAPSKYNQKMAADTVYQLVNIYPPATTKFNFQQETGDVFGETLMEKLRDSGYAVVELNKDESSSGSTHRDKTLSYIVDLQMTNLYRITILIGDETLSRAYVVQNNLLYPAGSWVYKE